jgi:hypothetical protein
VRLQNQRNTLDGGGVGTFAAFDEALFEKRLRISELRDALAGGALAAEVIREAFAIGGLREHARESEFANAARACEEQSVWDALAAESAAERGDDAFVAEKFREAHWSALFFPRGLRECD